MRLILLLCAATGVGLFAAACGTSGGSEADETLGRVRQAVPFPTLSPTVKPPGLHLEPFTTSLPNAPNSYESALRVRVVRLGLDGYVLLARRITTQPALRVSYVVYRLDTHAEPIWSRPYEVRPGYTLQDVREYQGPDFKGFVLAGYTGASCGTLCTPNSGFLTVLDGTGFERATSFYALPGDGVTRLRAVNQAPDGSLLAVGETTTRGSCQRLNGSTYYKPLYQHSGFFVAQQNLFSGGHFITGSSLTASVCPEPQKGTPPTSSELHSLIVMGDGRRVVAVGSRLNEVSHRYEALNLALAPSGATGWSGASAASLLSAASYGNSLGNTYGRSVARVDADSFILAGYTSAFNAAGRTGNAGFMRRHALGGDATFQSEWLTGDPAAGTYFSAAPGWRLFGGSVPNQFEDVAVSGGYALGVGPADQPWNARYLTYLTTAAPTDNGLMGRVNVADGNDKLVSSFPKIASLFYRRAYDAGLSGVTPTVGPGFAVAGFAKRPGDASKVLLAQLDADLTTDGTFVPPADPEPPPDPDPPDPDLWAEAEDTFTHKCKTCHGADHAGKGDAPCLIGISRSCAINRVSCGAPDSDTMVSFCDRLNFEQVEDLADYLVAYVPDAGVTCRVDPKCGQATGLPECHEKLCATAP